MTPILLGHLVFVLAAIAGLTVTHNSGYHNGYNAGLKDAEAKELLNKARALACEEDSEK